MAENDKYDPEIGTCSDCGVELPQDMRETLKRIAKTKDVETAYCQDCTDKRPELQEAIDQGLKGMSDRHKTAGELDTGGPAYPVTNSGYLLPKGMTWLDVCAIELAAGSLSDGTGVADGYEDKWAYQNYELAQAMLKAKRRLEEEHRQ